MAGYYLWAAPRPRFLHALDAVTGKVPGDMAAGWLSRAEAIRVDLQAAAGSLVPSAP